ncbi:MAG: DUF2243 domain-containing protein, partial [Comamonadaceae bacterium]
MSADRFCLDSQQLDGFAAASARRALRAPGLLLGIALGGFFDGILLHQVLQWHHLLSDADWARAHGLGFQLLADGLFHALMYVLALAGLGWLWARRRALGDSQAGQALVAWLLAGFGAWHVADALLSHWLLGIHRVRSDVANPLLWDLGWLAVFGVLPLLSGWLRLAAHARAPVGKAGARPLLGWALAWVTVTAAAVSAWAPALGDVRVVVFQAGMTPVQVFEVLDRIGASVVRTDAQARVWALAVPADVSAAALYRSGALLVGG